MKIDPKIIFIGIIIAVISPVMYAQEYDNYYDDDYYNEYNPDEAESAFSDIGNNIFLSFGYGAAVSWLTRIINQKERSDFLFEDFLAGLYFNAQLHNIKYITPAVRLAAYYPIKTTFNGVPQKPKSPLHFGADVLAGVQFDVRDFGKTRVNLGPAFHMFFLSSDRWNYFNMGGAAVLGIEVPLTAYWTLLIGGYASLDSGNLGGNRKKEPFDITYQYQLDIGLKFSRKKPNTATLFDSQNSAEKQAAVSAGSYEEDYYEESNKVDDTYSE